MYWSPFESYDKPGSPIPPSENYSGLTRELEVSVYAPATASAPDIQSNYMPAHIQSTDQQNHTINWSNSNKYGEKIKPHGRRHKYYFNTPYQEYFALVGVLGQPSLVDPGVGGMAVWTHMHNATYSFLERVEIVDEYVYNNFPYPHTGFVYTYIKLKIPTSMLNRVLSLCGDISYDPIKHVLKIRGMTLDYNIAMSLIVCLYVSGSLSWYNILERCSVRKVVDVKNLKDVKKCERNARIVRNISISTFREHN